MEGRSSDKENRPVFYDGKGTRWKYCKSIWFTGTLLAIALIIFFLTSIVSAPFLPQLRLKYVVMVRSVLKAVRGAVVGWGKLERKATVGVELT